MVRSWEIGWETTEGNWGLSTRMIRAARSVSTKANDNSICWSIVNGEASYFKNKVAKKWVSLLNDRTLKERSYQAFLAENAGLFFCDGIDRLVAISTLKLGAGLVTDFVNTRSALSYGFFYELIEIKSPHAEPYTKLGNQSASLVRAIQQVHSWQRWIEKNREAAKTLFPSAIFSIHDELNFEFTIYIGRRENSRKWLERRNHDSKKLNISIRSFDALTDRVRQRPVLDYWIGGDELPYQPLSRDVRNQLMNPFTKAYSDQAWRRMTGDPAFRRFHMITTNVDSLLKNREYSPTNSSFLRYWKNIPPKTKAVYLNASRKHYI